MTIEEEIKHCEEKAKGCSKCAGEHAQLAVWLKELVKLRKNQDKHEKILTMTDKEKHECKEHHYTCDNNGNRIICDGKCNTCKFSYDFVDGYNSGYSDCYLSDH